MVTKVRLILYTHLLIVVALARLALIVLKPPAELDHEFQHHLETFLFQPVVRWAYPFVMFTGFAFLVALIAMTSQIVPWWRRLLLFATDFALALLQVFTLGHIWPVRY